jgi:chorismate synthase
MGGNSFGTLFQVTTWGESHGKALGVVIDGCPPQIELSGEDIQKEMERRRPGQSIGSSPRKERDRIEILSGVFEGKTLGSPISIIIWNEDVDSTPYDEIRDIFRPGHADFTYQAKYGIRDHRGGGRASARETVGRVAGGAVAKKILEKEKMEILAYTVELGGIRIEKMDYEEIERNVLRCPDQKAAVAMEKKIEETKERGDTLGGIVEILVRGCPPGLGDPVYDKLEADFAKALMSIGAVRGVEIGAGFGVTRMFGSQCNDPLGPEGFEKNDAGGILGGISNGANLLLRVAVKPVPSIHLQQKTVDSSMRPVALQIKGKHDVSPIPRINSVCEAMVAIVLVDHLLRQKALDPSSHKWWLKKPRKDKE